MLKSGFLVLALLLALYVDSAVAMGEVAIDPIVIYLLGAVCTFAFVPPCVCKLRQMFCTVSEQVGDEYGMSPEGY